MSPTDDVPRDDTSDALPAERVATTPPARARVEDLTGQCVAGRYVVQQRVGAGPIGQVYRALRSADGVQVALKVLHERHRPDPNVVRRFAREAQAAAQLDHPNIARVLEHGIDDAGRPFSCSEWAAGVPITQAVLAGPLTLRRVLVPVCQALSALAEAHRQGVLHRGLKPSNLLVSETPEDGFVTKVCDFGMAKLLKPVPGTLTSKHKMPCGVAEYAAPEQAVTTELDGRADVYAMGVVLYELLTGQVPFRGGNDAAVLAKHQREPVVPPQKLRVDRFIPREVESICMKALSKQATDRYRSPREFGSALSDTLELLGVRADLPIEAPLAASADADHLSKDRLTMPGEQLRSRQKIGLGVGLLLLVCSIIWLSAPNETRETRPTPDVAGASRTAPAENAALAEGRRRLAEDDVKGAAEELARAREQLGETPELARWLGEALLRSGQRERGEALLRRYLELVPHANDRETVDALLSSETSSR